MACIWTFGLAALLGIELSLLPLLGLPILASFLTTFTTCFAFLATSLRARAVVVAVSLAAAVRCTSMHQSTWQSPL